MFRSKSHSPVVVATFALAAACPILTRAADDPALADASPADEAAATHGPGSKAPGTSDTYNLPAVVVTAQRLNTPRLALEQRADPGLSPY